jgi:hypothetical protein
MWQSQATCPPPLVCHGFQLGCLGTSYHLHLRLWGDKRRHQGQLEGGVGGFKTDFLEERDEPWLEGQNDNGTPGTAKSRLPLPPSVFAGWLAGWAGLVTAPQPNRLGFSDAERGTLSNASLGHKAGHLGPPSPWLRGGAAPATAAGAVATAHLAQVSCPTPARAPAAAEWQS